MLVPTLMAVTPVVDELGLVTTPVPETKLHVPDPTEGVFPLSVALVAQIVCEGPALAVVGKAETDTEIVAPPLQVPLVPTTV